MALFNEFLYVNLGIALSVPSPNEPIHTETPYVPYYIDAPYSQESSQLHITTYSIKQDCLIFPKRNFHQLYASIAQSNWFAKSYKGKSLGDFIEVDY